MPRRREVPPLGGLPLARDVPDTRYALGGAPGSPGLLLPGVIALTASLATDVYAAASRCTRGGWGLIPGFYASRF